MTGANFNADKKIGFFTFLASLKFQHKEEKTEKNVKIRS